MENRLKYRRARALPLQPGGLAPCRYNPEGSRPAANKIHPLGLKVDGVDPRPAAKYPRAALQEGE